MLTVFLITARMVSESSATKILKAIAFSPASLSYSILAMRRLLRCPDPLYFLGITVPLLNRCPKITEQTTYRVRHKEPYRSNQKSTESF
jgi:hypothetical protein